MKQKQALRAVAACAALAALAALALGAYAHAGRAVEREGATSEPRTDTHTTQETASAAALATDAQGVFHLLLVGVDAANEQQTQRSDSMLVLSLDLAQKRAVLTSFMRDIYCDIPGHGASRLNHAYMWGGIELLRQTLAENFGVSPEHYVQVTLEGFCAAMDTVGGVELALTEAEAERLGLSTGLVRLDGETALEYARLRDIGNADYDRTARQRKLLAALFDHAGTLSLRELLALAQALWPQVETNLTWPQLLALAQEDWRLYDLSQWRVPMEGTITDRVVDGMMVLEIDFERNRRAWREAVYGESE